MLHFQVRRHWYSSKNVALSKYKIWLLTSFEVQWYFSSFLCAIGINFTASSRKKQKTKFRHWGSIQNTIKGDRVLSVGRLLCSGTPHNLSCSKLHVFVPSQWSMAQTHLPVTQHWSLLWWTKPSLGGRLSYTHMHRHTLFTCLLFFLLICGIVLAFL